MFPTRNHTPIAVEVHADQIIAVQLLRRKGQWQTGVSVSVRRQPAAVQADTSSLTLTEVELTALRRGLIRQGAIGREMVLMAPAGATCVELLELPPRSAQTPIDMLARAEMGRLARWDESTPFQVTTWDVPSPVRRAGADAATSTSLYAAALAETSIAPLINQLWAAGWSVQAVVPAPLAAAALFATDSASPSANGVIVVVDLRSTHAALTLVRGGVAIYHRDLPDNGIALLLRGIVAEVGMTAENAASALESGSIELHRSGARSRAVCESFAEALAGELEASLAFAARRYGEVNISQLALVGAGARIGGLSQWLRSRLEIADPTAPDTLGDPTFAPCVALARRAAKAIAEPGLLPSAQRELIKREQVARLWLAGAAMVAVSALTGVAALYAMNMAPSQADEARLVGFDREQARADADAAEANRALADIRARSNFEDRLSRQPDYSAVLRLIGGTIDPSTVLRDISLAEGTSARPAANPVAGPAVDGRAAAIRKVKIAGTASAPASLTEQVALLRAIDVFANVELARTSRSPTGEGVNFELTLDLVSPVAKKGAK